MEAGLRLFAAVVCVCCKLQQLRNCSRCCTASVTLTPPNTSMAAIVNALLA